MTTAKTVGAVSSEAMEWYAINWQTIHQNVRRLQVRIVQATKAGRWNKVKSLQRLLTHIEAASPSKRRSQGLSCVRGNLHAQFLEGRAPAMGSGYSVFPACSFHEDT